MRVFAADTSSAAEQRPLTGVTLVTSDPDVVTVDAQGTVPAVGPGVAFLTASLGSADAGRRMDLALRKVTTTLRGRVRSLGVL